MKSKWNRHLASCRPMPDNYYGSVFVVQQSFGFMKDRREGLETM